MLKGFGCRLSGWGLGRAPLGRYKEAITEGQAGHWAGRPGCQIAKRIRVQAIGLGTREGASGAL